MQYSISKQSIFSDDKRDSGTCDHSEQDNEDEDGYTNSYDYDYDDGQPPQWPTREMVYSLLKMLGTNDPDDLSKTLLNLSISRQACKAMRQCGCIQLLVQLIHSPTTTASARTIASKALRNIVQGYDKEMRVFKLLEDIRLGSQFDINLAGPAIGCLMKFSFDESFRKCICTLGGLEAISDLLKYENHHQSCDQQQHTITLRRYACMALTNLTFGDAYNKRLLCSRQLKPALISLIDQLKSPSDDLRQVAASVIRNLSWRADTNSKKCLQEIGTIKHLIWAAMNSNRETTLKSMLSALWNLSAHSTSNKSEICQIKDSLVFLITTLSYRSTTIVENGGGILRNVSSLIALREDYRMILRQHNAFQILLNHLKSSSLTVVSNCCGTLWNLSARNVQDQKYLVDLGAVQMLSNLVESKHKMIRMGATAALKNLLQLGMPAEIAAMSSITRLSSTSASMPGLYVRKLKAFQRDLAEKSNVDLNETCDNLDTSSSAESTPRQNNSPVFSKRNNASSSFSNSNYNNNNCNIYQTFLMGERVFYADDQGILQQSCQTSRPDDQATPSNSTLLTASAIFVPSTQNEIGNLSSSFLTTSEQDLLLKCTEVKQPKIRRSTSSHLKIVEKQKNMKSSRPKSILVQCTGNNNGNRNILINPIDYLPPPPPEFDCKYDKVVKLLEEEDELERLQLKEITERKIENSAAKPITPMSTTTTTTNIINSSVVYSNKKLKEKTEKTKQIQPSIKTPKTNKFSLIKPKILTRWDKPPERINKEKANNLKKINNKRPKTAPPPPPPSSSSSFQQSSQLQSSSSTCTISLTTSTISSSLKNSSTYDKLSSLTTKSSSDCSKKCEKPKKEAIVRPFIGGTNNKPEKTKTEMLLARRKATNNKISAASSLSSSMIVK